MAIPSDYDQILLSSIEVPEYLTTPDKANFKKAIDELFELKNFLDKINYIVLSKKIPVELVSTFEITKKRFTEIYVNLTLDYGKEDSIKAGNSIKRACEQVSIFKRDFFTISSSNYALQNCNAIFSFGETDLRDLVSRNQDLSNDLETELEKIKKINKELEDKAAKSVVSNYAEIFRQQELKNKKNSNTWLAIAIIFTSFTILFLILSFAFDWFKTTTLVTSSTNSQLALYYIYNVPNIVTKIFIISLLIYLISFFFKQYSISMHLVTLNSHKKNALNSYNLFTESISEKDTSSRNTLMLQVAKAIYENSTTGYLSFKTSESNSPGILEITKLISDNK